MTATANSDFNLTSLAGIILIMGGITFSIAAPQLPIWVPSLIGIALGTPLLIVGMRRSSEQQRLRLAATSGEPVPSAEGREHFWPTRQELWSVTAGLTLIATILLPYLMIIPIFLLMPVGDSWPIVLLRLTSIAAFIAGVIWWFRFARSHIPSYFRGKISDERLDAFLKEEPVEVPKSARAAAVKNWNLPAIALVALFLATGVIDVNHPALAIDNAPRRTRGIVKVLVWCRGNPNTVRSSAALVTIAALLLYAQRIQRAHHGQADVDQTEADQAMNCASEDNQTESELESSTNCDGSETPTPPPEANRT